MNIQVGDWVKYHSDGKNKLGEVVEVLGNSCRVHGSQRQIFLVSIVEARRAPAEEG